MSLYNKFSSQLDDDNLIKENSGGSLYNKLTQQTSAQKPIFDFKSKVFGTPNVVEKAPFQFESDIIKTPQTKDAFLDVVRTIPIGLTKGAISSYRGFVRGATDVVSKLNQKPIFDRINKKLLGEDYKEKMRREVDEEVQKLSYTMQGLDDYLKYDVVGEEDYDRLSVKMADALGQGLFQVGTSVIPGAGYAAIGGQAVDSGYDAYSKAYNTLKEEGATDKEAEKLAYVNGIASGIINMADVIIPAKVGSTIREALLRPVKKSGVFDVSEKVSKKFLPSLWRVGKTTLTEAGTEGLQELGTAGIAKATYDEDRQPFGEALTAFIISLPTALFFGGVQEGATRMSLKKQEKFEKQKQAIIQQGIEAGLSEEQSKDLVNMVLVAKSVAPENIYEEQSIEEINEVKNIAQQFEGDEIIAEDIDTILTPDEEKADEALFQREEQIGAEEDLIKEAKKYKTAEEFVKKIQGSATQYGDYFPNLRKFGMEDYKNITELGIDPEEMITIYRGIDDTTGKIPKKINDGDFVTTDYDSAWSYAGDNVVSMEVPAKTLYTDAIEDFTDEPFYTGSEYVYTTEKVTPMTKSQLEEIWKKANKPKMQKRSKVKKIGFVTPQEALDQAMDIPIFKELASRGQVMLSEQLSNPRALGSYYKQIIKFVKNPHKTTLPHEAFHAFADMVLTESEKMQALSLVKTSGMSNLQAEEILAQRFAEWYVGKKEKSLLQRIFTKIKDFFTGLLGKQNDIEKLFNSVLDENLVNRIRVFDKLGGIEKLRAEFYQNPADFTYELFEKSEIWKKPKLKKATIIGTLGTLRKPLMKEFVANKLDTEFTGQDIIDTEELRRSLFSDLLDIKIITSDKYADYGIANIYTGYMKDIEAKTYILNTNFVHGKTGHFSGEFKSTISKDDLEIRTIKAGIHDGQRVDQDQYYVVRKDLSASNLVEGTFGKFDSEKQAQKYIDKFSDRTTDEPGLFGHFRAYQKLEDKNGAFNVVEIQSDVFQDSLASLARSNKRLMENELKIVQDDIDSRIKQISGLNERILSLKNNIKTIEEDIKASNEFESDKKYLSGGSSIKVPKRSIIEDFQLDIDALERQIIQKQDYIDKQEKEKQEIIERFSTEDPQYFTRRKLEKYDEIIDAYDSIGGYINSINERPDTFVQLNYLGTELNRLMSDNVIPEETDYSVKLWTPFTVSEQTENISLIDFSPQRLNNLLESNTEYGYKNRQIIKNKLQEIFDKASKNIPKKEDFVKVTPQEKKEIALSEQFLAFKNNYYETIINTAIREASIKDAGVIRFATPYTVANIEGYISKNDDFDSGMYTEEEIRGMNVGDSIDGMGNEAILTHIGNTEYNIIYTDSRDGLHVVSEDDIIDGEREHRQNEFNDLEDLDNVKDTFIKYVNGKQDENTLSDKEVEELHTQIENAKTIEDLESIDGFETVKSTMVDDYMSDFNVEDFYDGIYGSSNRNGYQTFEDERGRVFYVDAGGSEVYEESQSYKTSYEGSAEDFKLEDIPSEEHRNIASKYGVDGDKEGQFYKYIKKKRKDLREVIDEEGFSWYESDITPDDRASVELFQMPEDIEGDKGESTSYINDQQSKKLRKEDTKTDSTEAFNDDLYFGKNKKVITLQSTNKSSAFMEQRFQEFGEEPEPLFPLEKRDDIEQALFQEESKDFKKGERKGITVGKKQVTTKTAEQIRELRRQEQLKDLQEGITRRLYKKQIVEALRELPRTSWGKYLNRTVNIGTSETKFIDTLDAIRKEKEELAIETTDDAREARVRQRIGYLRHIFDVKPFLILSIKKHLDIKDVYKKGEKKGQQKETLKSIKDYSLEELTMFLQELNKRLDFIRENQQSYLSLVQTEKEKESTNALIRTIQKADATFISPLERRLQKINEGVYESFMSLFFNQIKNTKKDFKNLEPLFALYDTMSLEDQELAKRYSQSSQESRLKEVLYQYDTQENVDQMLQSAREVFDNLHAKLKDVNINVPYRGYFFPRKLKKLKAKDINFLIKEFELKEGKTASVEERREIVNSIMQGFDFQRLPYITLSGKRFEARRLVETITPEISPFFEDMKTAMASYIVAANQTIEQRKFFGKFQVDTMDYKTSIENSIGGKIADMLDKGLIQEKDIDELRDIMQLIFNFRIDKHQENIMQFTNDYVYPILLGQLTSTINQLNDLSMHVVLNDVFAKQNNTFGGMTITREDIFQDTSFLELETALKSGDKGFAKFARKWMTPFQKSDDFFLTVFANSAFRRIVKEAKVDSPTLKKKLIEIFGDVQGYEVLQNLKTQDSKNPNIDDDIARVLFSEIARVRPITKLQKAEGAIRYPLIYVLKNFGIKQFQLVRRESFDYITKGAQEKNKAMVIKGLARLTIMASMLAFYGAGVEEIKDWILGRSQRRDFGDRVFDSMLRTIFLNSYVIDTGAIQDIVVPPTFSFTSQIVRDAIQDVKDTIDGDPLYDAKLLRRVPLIGNIFYYQIGGGN